METANVHTLKTNANMIYHGLGKIIPLCWGWVGMLRTGGDESRNHVSEHKKQQNKNTKANHLSIERNNE